MATIALETQNVPAACLKNGQVVLTLGHGDKLKVQTTGDVSEVVFLDGPPAHKTWAVQVFLRVLESDT